MILCVQLIIQLSKQIKSFQTHMQKERYSTFKFFASIETVDANGKEHYRNTR